MISQQDRLAGLVACLNATIAKANRELQACGDWSCDWQSLMGQYEQQIESILEINTDERKATQ